MLAVIPAPGLIHCMHIEWVIISFISIMASINPAQAFSIGADAVYLSARPLPIAPTGYYDWEVSSDPAERRQGHSAVTNLINQVRPLSN
jgi:hypothetical protein